MSDFLSRLGARQVGEPAIRPRAVSRFETAAASPTVASGGGRDVDVGATASLLAVDPVRSTPLFSMDGPVPGATPPSAQPHSRFADTMVNAGDADAPRAGDVEQRLRDFAKSLSQPAIDRMTSAREIEGRGALEPRASKPSDPVDATIRPDAPSAATPRATSIAPGTDARPSNLSHASGDVPERGEVSVREPDVINVHIGRVEVRAVLSETERARPRAQASVSSTRPLSLDRYLSAKDRV